MRIERLRALLERGMDLRLWCFRCGRGAVMPIPADDLDRVAAKAVCSLCRQRDDILLLPARSTFEPCTAEKATALAVEALFHGLRAQRKRRRAVKPLPIPTPEPRE